MDDLELGRYIERLDTVAQQLLESNDRADKRHADHEERFEQNERRIEMMEKVYSNWNARLDGSKWTAKLFAAAALLVILLATKGFIGTLAILLEWIRG